MVAALTHRGPDDHGVHVEPGLGLGHTRLSIIDLSPLGHQPMASASGDVVIVYNGEIYNFPELRSELEGLGARFRSHSDTEVVLRAYERWGQDSFRRLNGMFALAIWDRRSQELHLVRDRFGIKPLYVAIGRDRTIFASEIGAILCTGLVDRARDPQALHEYMWFGNPLGERTAYAAIRKLLPGHALTISRTGAVSRRFASLVPDAPSDDSLPVAVERVRHLFDAAVRRQLRSDVPVGVFLSGGVDSSAITAFASRATSGKLRTYSAAFDFQSDVNELPQARRLAEAFDTEHHELYVRADGLPETITNLVAFHGEPFGDAADIPLYLLSRELKGEISVVLQGDGGDELFGGYRRYRILAREALWHQAARVVHPLTSRLTDPRIQRGDRLVAALAQDDAAMRMALLLTQDSFRAAPTAVLGPGLREEVASTDPFIEYRKAAAAFAAQDPRQRMLYTDMQVLLPNTFLEKVDKATMAHSIEARVPFLDNDLAAYAMSLPSHYKARARHSKWILKRALRGRVPDYVLDAPKNGFSVPFGNWLRQPLRRFMEEVLFDESVRAAGLFDAAMLEQRVREHVTGRRNNGFLLWKCLNLGIWSELDRRGAQCQ